MRRIGPTRPAVAEAVVWFERAAARFFDVLHLVEFAGARGEVVVNVAEESASGQPVRARILKIDRNTHMVVR
ncbi:hypothetical protein [Aliiroseovarius crassostreae]|uniref:hypothetical protein n=1 Tax=Aliiroseovarius crassostreae TaxID=154981 RepID=UPI00220C773B|nr:hypothetical protein [Aliiroseovarius crassostreae]UWP99362.1 hypothetical protein K3X53_04225 [Aliiroseovarius crassostreae]